MDDPVVITMGNRFKMGLYLGLGLTALGAYVAYGDIVGLMDSKFAEGGDARTTVIIGCVVAAFLLVFGLFLTISFFRMRKGYLAIGSSGIEFASSKTFTINWVEISQVALSIQPMNRTNPLRVLNPERAVADLLAHAVTNSRAISLKILILLAGTNPDFAHREDLRVFKLPEGQEPYTHALLVPVTLHGSSKNIPEIPLVYEALLHYAGQRRVQDLLQA